MKSITVLLRDGRTHLFLKGQEWELSTLAVYISDDKRQVTAAFPTDAIAGIWFSDSEEPRK